MKQIQIITQNRTGALDDMLQILAAAQINVESIDCEAVEQHGVVSLMVNQYEEAFKLLTHAGYQAIAEEVLVLTVADTPGALGKISHELREAEIGIRSIRILERAEGQSTVGLVTDNNESARALLQAVVVG